MQTGLALIVLAGSYRLLASRRTWQPFGRRLWLALALPGFALVSYSFWVASGSDSPASMQVGAGVSYERLPIENAVVHLVTIDLDENCVSLATSEVNPDGTAEALKTVTWARRERMTVAVNASFFYPYDQSRFWDVYPAEGEEVTVLGPVIPAGAAETGVVASGPADWPGEVLALTETGRPTIGGTVPDGAVLAVGGRQRILQDGQIVATNSVEYPRTIVGIAAESATMWWLVADGNQPGYSEGLSLAAAAGILRSLGATDALELDGGGSSTMVLDDGNGPRRISRTMQIRIPGRSRAVANHLGLQTVDLGLAGTC